VALVHCLEEGNLGVTGQVDVLGAISYELHKSSGHFTIPQENNMEQPSRGAPPEALNFPSTQ
jgi:hypothetical protein